MTPAAILRAARALIDTEERWTKEEYARDASGDPVNPDDDEAVCYCVIGALMAVSTPGTPEYAGAISVLRNAMGCADDLCIPYVQDSLEYTHAQLLSDFDRAIAAADAADG